MSQQFDESKHRRAGDGTFSVKGLTEADGGAETDLGAAAGLDEPLSWENHHRDLQQVLLSASELQDVLPHAVLVGGSVAALYAGHRASYDHDHVMGDLKERYEEVRAAMASLPEWDESTRATKPPMTIMGGLGQVEAGVRQLRRSVPLETTSVLLPDGRHLTVPTLQEALRVKAFLVVQRNQVRDYLDVAALSNRIGAERAAGILLDIGRFYPEQKDLATRVTLQLAEPDPKDSRVVQELSGYKGLAPHWQDWDNVRRACMDVAAQMIERSQ